MRRGVVRFVTVALFASGTGGIDCEEKNESNFCVLFENRFLLKTYFQVFHFHLTPKKKKNLANIWETLKLNTLKCILKYLDLKCPLTHLIVCVTFRMYRQNLSDLTFTRECCL